MIHPSIQPYIHTYIFPSVHPSIHIMRFSSCSGWFWLWLWWIASFRRLHGQNLEPEEEDDDDNNWLVPLIVSSTTTTSRGSSHNATEDGFVWHNLSVRTHRAGGMPILQPSSFVVQNGQVTGLLGPSGTSKCSCARRKNDGWTVCSSKYAFFTHSFRTVQAAANRRSYPCLPDLVVYPCTVILWEGFR